MKKNERLLEQLGKVDDKYIVEAAPGTESKKNHVKWSVIGAMGAAAAGIILWQGTKNIPDRITGKKIPESTTTTDQQIESPTNNTTSDQQIESPTQNKTYGQRIEFPEISGDLPIIHTPGAGGEAMGFEGFKAYDVSELLDGNPSRENCEFTELPVFIRSEHADYSKDRNIYSIEEMDEKLKEIAAQLTDEEYVTGYANRHGYDLAATAGDITLRMTSYGDIGIEFENAVDLPDEFGIYTIKNNDRAQITASLEYLGEKYGSIFGLSAPVPSFSIHYNIYDDPGTGYYLYDDSDDPLTALMNYSFGGLSFTGEDIQIDDPDKYANPYDAYEYTGDLTYIRYYNYLSALEFTGMYPVIGYEQAFEELLNGNYHTTVWEEAYLPEGIDPEEVTFTGIMYKRTQDYKYELPYYRFLIELHAERTGEYALSEGMKEYGAFYVPAVSPDYLVIENTDVAYN